MIRRVLASAALILVMVLLVASLLLVEAMFFAAPPVNRGDAASLRDHITGELNSAVAADRVGATGLVLIEDGEIIFENGFGISDPETRAPVDPRRSMFLVASVSKQVTAWGVMKFVQEGRIGLDDPVLPRLKGWKFEGDPAISDKLTVRRLLTHTAGIQDGPLDGFFSAYDNVAISSGAILIYEDPATGQRRTMPITREPGSGFSYGSAAYTVLAFVIEDLAGKPFAEYMDESILHPLGMNVSTFDLDSFAGRHGDLSIVADFDHQLTVQPRRRLKHTAGAGFYTTPHDLGLFLKAYRGDNPVLRPETIREMISPQPETGGAWGLAHAIFADNGTGGHIIGHDGGSIPAWGAWLRFNPATGNGMVMNVSGGSGALNQLGHDWVYWETGQVTATARRQKVQNRITLAGLIIVVGSILIIGWQIFRTVRSRLRPIEL